MAPGGAELRAVDARADDDVGVLLCPACPHAVAPGKPVNPTATTTAPHRRGR
jgi:hypothetical protein